MLRQLASNTLISAVTLVLTGLVPLLLVPLLIHTYGIAQYGLLVLLRLLLPTGALAIADLGNSENAAYAVARSRHDGDWMRCGRFIAGLSTIGAIAGVLLAMIIAALTERLGAWFDIHESSSPGFHATVLVHALVFPILLVSLVSEGIVKGFEDFKRLRSIEIASTAVYASATLLVVRNDLSYQWAAVAFLLNPLVKAAMVLALARWHTRRFGMKLSLPTGSEWRDLRRRCIPLGINRAIGVGQSQAAPVLIGAMLGSSAVGIYDVVTRLPRFLKVVTGTLNSAVLPAVMRLQEAGDHGAVQRVLSIGLLGVLCAVLPAVSWAICFSEAILHVWVSDRYSHLWMWQATMFLWPLINTITSFLCGAMLGKPRFVQLQNWLVLAQVLLQLLLSLALIDVLSAQAFILGQIVALASTMPLQLMLVARFSGATVSAYGRHFSAVAVFSVVTIAGLMSSLSRYVLDAPTLLLSGFLWWAISTGLLWAFLLNPRERQGLMSLLPIPGRAVK